MRGVRFVELDASRRVTRHAVDQVATMSRTRQALSDALGLHPKKMMLAKVCDEYEGACHIIGTWRGWTDCEACGWPKDDHEDHS